MPPVPLLRPREVVRAFERLGWSVARQRGTLRALISKAGLSVGEFLSAIER